MPLLETALIALTAVIALCNTVMHKKAHTERKKMKEKLKINI